PTLERIQLAPFLAAIAARVPAMMSAHIVVPALDATPDLPVTLSKPVLTDLVRGPLGFGGVIVTDDLEMGALASIGEANAGLRALQAGADFLLFRFDETAQIDAHRRIVDAVRSGTITSARLEASVRKIVDLKRAYSIYLGRRDAPAPDLVANGRASLDLARDGITLLRNRAILPLRGRILAVPDVPAYICAYGGREPSLIAAAEILLGERKPTGSLPAEIPGMFAIGAGMHDFA